MSVPKVIRECSAGANAVAFALVVLLGTAACSREGVPLSSPLQHAEPTPEALAEAALVAMAAADTAGVERLLVSRAEYEQVLWPLLPDRDYVTFEFVWGMSAPRNHKALHNLMAEYGTLDMELLSVELGTEVEHHESLTLYRDARMLVRRTDTGVEGIFPLMDALVYIGGGWKFLNFRDDA